MWFWKEEPVSPTALDVEEEWLSFDDDRSAGDSIVKEEIVLYEEPTNPTRAQVATKLLEELDEFIKEGKFFQIFIYLQFKRVNYKSTCLKVLNIKKF